MKRPSFQFYPGDWLNDAALRACSVGARGLWMDMLCLMHQGSDYGHLKVNHTPILTPNLARMCGATLQETEGWLNELSQLGVFSKDDQGCIFSRRMIRDENLRSARAAGGKLGGNPALRGLVEVGPKVNLQPNLRPTPSSSSSSSSSIQKKGPTVLKKSPERPGDVCAEAWEGWIAHRKAKKAAVTDRVISSMRKSASDAGMTLEQAMDWSVQQNHQGFYPPRDGQSPALRRPAPGSYAERRENQLIGAAILTGSHKRKSQSEVEVFNEFMTLEANNGKVT